jgi:hypothetical protein
MVAGSEHSPFECNRFHLNEIFSPGVGNKPSTPKVYADYYRDHVSVFGIL